MLPFLRPGGQVIVSSRPVTPVMAALSGEAYRAEPMLDYLKAQVPSLLVVDGERAMREVGSPRVLNLILLGAALQSGALGLTEADLLEAMQRLIPGKFYELNLRALRWAGENK